MRGLCGVMAGLMIFSLSACRQEEKPKVQQLVAMDTAVTFSVYGPNGAEAAEQAADLMRELEGELSRTDENSQVSRLNDANGESVILDGSLPELLAAAKDYSTLTGGAFDVTIAPLADAWGFTTEAQRVPAPEELTAALARIGSGKIQMESHNGGTQVQMEPGQKIDLGGLAKGYASDRIEGIFAAMEIPRAVVDLGGNIYVRGTRPDGTPWRTGVRDPQNVEQLAAVLLLQDAFAITSGGYQRYFEEDGTRYHHILNPADGYPAESGLLSVTLVADANGWSSQEHVPGNGTMCDALSTALFVMGEEASLQFWRTSALAFDLVLVTEDGRVVLTSGLADRYKPMEGSGYRYEVVS